MEGIFIASLVDVTHQPITPDRVKNILPHIAYVAVAIKLAQARKKNQELSKEDKEHFNSLSKKTQQLIEHIENDLQSMPSSFIEDPDNPKSPHSLFDSKQWKNKESQAAAIQEHFEKHPNMLYNLEQHRVKDMEENKKWSNRINSYLVTPCLMAANVCTALYKNLHSIPGAEIAIAPLYLVYAGLHFIARLGQGAAMKSNPDLEGPKKIKAGSAFFGFASAACMTTGAIGVLVFAPWAAIPLAGAAILMSVSNLAAFGGAFKDLLKEWNQKEPEDTLYWRRFNHLTKTFGPITSAAFYACCSVLAVALLLNPVGIAALAGIIGGFAIGTAAVAIGSFIAGKLAEKKIESINKARIENTAPDKTDELSMGKDRSLSHENRDTAQNKNRAVETAGVQAESYIQPFDPQFETFAHVGTAVSGITADKPANTSPKATSEVQSQSATPPTSTSPITKHPDHTLHH